jgi:hypothetical protein
MNGGSSMMPMLSSSAMSVCVVAALGVGAFFWLNKSEKPTQSPVTSAPTDEEEDKKTPVSLEASTYRLKNGGLTMSVDNSNCSNRNVQMADGVEGDKGQWIAVPVRDNVYNIKSNARQMMGCDVAFLTASSSCNGTSLEQPKFLDRQEWEVMDVGGKRTIRSVSCKNSNLPSYLSGGGRGESNRNVGLTSKGGSPFIFEAVV